MPTTIGNLFTVIRHWPDLEETLGAKAAPSWPPAGRMADFVRDVEQRHAEEDLAAQRALERNPAQIGERPIPIRPGILDTMMAVHQDLLDCADHVAASVQKPVLQPLPEGYSPEYRRRHDLLVLKDRRDPRRWRWDGTRPDVPYTALWLLARVQGAGGPFRPLTAALADHVAGVARAAAQRVEAALDIAGGAARLVDPCPLCGGRITMHGGAGAVPVARCASCGTVWGGGSAGSAPPQPLSCP
ncbi:hypothetical protein OG481_09695 [Streptomyces longwoodensis]|uniref:hypothetical protein n=1 Tax=Streptomyces longwoodensis TaxID=68231 RepID=UPI002DD9FF45|nr:hypothetical protein [Streptomyces longwoodensis]WRY88789.1 hypothetical protein OG481_09695 [Streptomyces longwoodensis]